MRNVLPHETWGSHVANQLLGSSPASMGARWADIKKQAEDLSRAIDPGEPPSEPSRFGAWLSRGYDLVFENCCEALLLLVISKPAESSEYKKRLSDLKSTLVKLIIEEEKSHFSLEERDGQRKNQIKRAIYLVERLRYWEGEAQKKAEAASAVPAAPVELAKKFAEFGPRKK